MYSKKITADDLNTCLNLIDTARLPQENIKLTEIQQTLTTLLSISQNSHSANDKKDKAQAAWDSIARIICIHGALYKSPEIINSINMSPLALPTTSINTGAETVIEFTRSNVTF